MKNKLFVMSAASGAGKTTLKDKVIGEFPDIVYSISATTRKPREGEVDGVHYFFKTKEAVSEKCSAACSAVCSARCPEATAGWGSTGSLR